jgi:type VI secretion system protein ImpJ
MEKSYKILWYEGMNLEPHHFQQWDRFIGNNLNFRIKTVKASGWGLSAIEIDEDALPNGKFNILSCKGIMPDGLIFDVPENDSLPASREFTEYFSSTQASLGVYLSITTERIGEQNYSLDKSTNKRNTRYYFDQVMISDENSGAGEREIGIAKTDLKILFESESLEDLSTLKIAEITRSTEGEYSLSKEYIAPCVNLNASDNLIALVRRVFELLIARSSALRKRRRQLSDGNLEMTPNDMPIFWLLFTANAYIPVLNQFLTDGNIHPAEIYTYLLTLTGQLTTFSTDENVLPQDFPVYDHTNCAKGFMKIEKNLMQLLGDITPAKNYVQIDLEKKGDTIFVGQVKDSSVIKESRLFLICSSETADENLINDLPAKLRIASPDLIKQVLASATPALPIKYVPRPPAGVPVQPQSYYFRLEKDEKFWKPIETNKAVVIFKPAEFKEIKLELIAVKTAE